MRFKRLTTLFLCIAIALTTPLSALAEDAEVPSDGPPVMDVTDENAAAPEAPAPTPAAPDVEPEASPTPETPAPETPSDDTLTPGSFDIGFDFNLDLSIFDGFEIDLSGLSEPVSEPTMADWLLPSTAPLRPVEAFDAWSLSAYAKEEVYALDDSESPRGSDCVKYNSWYYGMEVSNPLRDGEYIPQYNWNAVFISWCAEQAGLIDLKRLPKTADPAELVEWLQDNGEIVDDAHNAAADDIIAIKHGNDYICGIVTGCADGEITYVVGDSGYTVKSVSVPVERLRSSAVILRWKLDSVDSLIPCYVQLTRSCGLSPAAAVGVLANMQCESGFNPHALGDGGTSYGLCQWHLGRWTALVDFCSENNLDWEDAEGQIRFLQHELERYSDLAEQVNALPNTPAGAAEAASLFCERFERPANTEVACFRRGDIAENTLAPALWRE